MSDNRIGRVIVYGTLTLLAVAAACIWPESHYPYISVGVFGIRLLDALWEDK